MVTVSGFVYILRSLRNGTFYIGSTGDLERRIFEHKEGRSTYTREILPIELVFNQRYKTLKMARRIEYRLKRLRRKDIIERIIREGIIRIV